MKKLKVDTVFCGVPMTLVGQDYNKSTRRPPKSEEVELLDVVIDDVSIAPLINEDDWRILDERFLEAANDDWRGDALEHADRLHDERRFG